MKNMPTYLHSRKRHGPEPHGEGESHTSGNHEQVEDFVETQHSWEGIGPFASINDGPNGIKKAAKHKQGHRRPWDDG